MPVYNGDQYLREAIDSILNQDFTDFEFVIIDDGSDDESLQIIRSYTDSRIRLIIHDSNQGLIRTLNEGLVEARGELIARMDCDDICHPNRLDKQVAFMDQQPQVGVCGTWFELMPSRQQIKHPESDAAIKVGLLKHSMIGHPTAVIRKSILEKYNLYYNASYPHAEDYAFWVACARHTRLANIPEVLLWYRQHEQQISQKYAMIQEQTTDKILAELIGELGIVPMCHDLDFHKSIVIKQSLHLSRVFMEGAYLWIFKLKQANKKYKKFEEPYFSELFSFYERQLNQFRKQRFSISSEFSSGIALEFYLSPLKHYRHFGWKYSLKFLLKFFPINKK